MTRRHTPRITTFSYEGSYRYSWTICTHLRRPVFVADTVVVPVLSQFMQTSEKENVAILAYCFMPDHVHLLLQGEREKSCAVDFVSKVKQVSGYWFKREQGVRLWQKTSWDRVLRSEDDTWTVIRYILANPVRAGLVARPMEYPYSGSLAYSREQLLEAFLDGA